MGRDRSFVRRLSLIRWEYLGRPTGTSYIRCTDLFSPGCWEELCVLSGNRLDTFDHSVGVILNGNLANPIRMRPKAPRCRRRTSRREGAPRAWEATGVANRLIPTFIPLDFV